MHYKIHKEVVLCPEYSMVSNNIYAVVFTAKYVVALAGARRACVSCVPSCPPRGSARVIRQRRSPWPTAVYVGDCSVRDP